MLDTKPAVARIRAAGGEALALQCDVTDSRSVAAMVADTVREFGKLDILVANAGIFANLRFKKFTELSSEEWDRVMAVNVRGVFECAKAVAPEMKKQGYGKIVNIASGTIFKGTPMLLHYVTSKAAVLGMTRCLARELGADGIRVNTLAPGLVVSEGVTKNDAWTRDLMDTNNTTRALKRDAAPEDMTGTMIYLCSAESDFVTGQCVVVDGGSVMH